MSKKMCELCGVGPAEVPDRNRPEVRFVKRICRQCHGKRLLGDLNEIRRLQERRKRQGGS